MAAKPAKASAPNARPTGGNGAGSFSQILQQVLAGQTGAGSVIPGLPGAFPNSSNNTTTNGTPTTQTGAPSVKVYKGGAVQIPLANPADVLSATMAAYQQALGRNPTPQELAAVQNEVNAQIEAKGQSDISTAQAQTESLVSLYSGGETGSNAPGAGPNGAATPQQVYQEVLAKGGTTEQAQVGAALVSGIESNGSPTELAGGIGPAQGLFQFEPGTWTGSAGGGKNGLPSSVGAASWQQQVQGFVNATKGNNFGAWGPDLGGSYGYGGPPMAGSKVANAIASGGASWASGAPGGYAASGGVGGGNVFSPVGPGLTQGRTDQGVDYGGRGNLFAVGSGQILSVSNSGWPGGAFVALKLDNPPDPLHSVVYYAEDLSPNVKVGQRVNAGDMIGQANGGSNGIEIGWGNPSAIGQPLNQITQGQYAGSGSTPEGQNFLNYISGAGGGGGLASLTPQQGAALKQAASEPGGAAYLSAMAAKNGGVTGGTGQGDQVLTTTNGGQIVVTPPIPNTYTQPASPGNQALMDAMYGHPTDYQANNLVNVFTTISQMLGAPKGGTLTSPVSVP